MNGILLAFFGAGSSRFIAPPAELTRCGSRHRPGCVTGFGRLRRYVERAADLDLEAVS
jgi:hypothetical protein